MHNVRKCIALASYFRQFIKDFGILAHPLTKLTRKKSQWHWSTKEEDVFKTIKEKLISRPVLAMYSPVRTDACKLGFGGILLQKQNDEKLHPVAFISKQTTPEESRYYSTELECC